MKRPVSLVASLVIVLAVLGACGAQAAGKAQIAEACSAKMKSAEKCACFSDNLETALTPEEFTTVAQSIDDNKRFTDLASEKVMSDPKLGSAIAAATTACFG